MESGLTPILTPSKTENMQRCVEIRALDRMEEKMPRPEGRGILIS